MVTMVNELLVPFPGDGLPDLLTSPRHVPIGTKRVNEAIQHCMQFIIYQLRKRNQVYNVSTSQKNSCFHVLDLIITDLQIQNNLKIKLIFFRPLGQQTITGVIARQKGRQNSNEMRRECCTKTLYFTNVRHSKKKCFCKCLFLRKDITSNVCY